MTSTATQGHKPLEDRRQGRHLLHRIWQQSAVWLGLIWLCGTVLLTACGSGTPASSESCVVGTTRTCSCGAGTANGTQVCATSGYAICNCSADLDAIGQLDGSHEVGTGDNSAGTDGPTNPCDSDKDCKATNQVCDPLRKHCVDCIIDGDCGPAQHCIDRQCQGFTSCTSAENCQAAKGHKGNSQPKCNHQTGECAECLTAVDCPASHDCSNNECKPFVSCKSSKDCPGSQLCNKATGRCANCVEDTDCAANQRCETGSCRPFTSCADNSDCAELGLVCNKGQQMCAECLTHGDCPALYHCAASGVAGTGECKVDVCTAGKTSCQGNNKVTCGSDGEGYSNPVPCPAQRSCVAPMGVAECKPWVCEPGATCTGGVLVTCSPDGLEILSTSACVVVPDCPPTPGSPKKYLKKSTAQCVECLENAHCGSTSATPVCDVVTDSCVAASKPVECNACGGLYPSCALVQGKWSCVECATTADCTAKNKGSCVIGTNICSGSAGMSKGACKSDADCPAQPGGGFDLACDTTTGLCYDKTGQCDNVSAFCNTDAGSVCILSGALLANVSIGSMWSTPSPSIGQCTCPWGGGDVGGSPGIKPECTAMAAILPNLSLCNCTIDPKSTNCNDIFGFGSCCINATNTTYGPGCITDLMVGPGTESKASSACFAAIQCSSALACITDVLGEGQKTTTWTCGSSSFGP